MKSKIAITIIAGLVLLGVAAYLRPGRPAAPAPLESPAVEAANPAPVEVAAAPWPIPQPQIEIAHIPGVPAGPKATNRLGRLMRVEEQLKVSVAELEPYLTANQRNATSLLGAFRTTGDKALLQEAMKAHPDDPRVALAAVQQADLSPAERQQWLASLQQSAPDNALPGYLSALDHFKAGDTAQGWQEIQAAMGKTTYDDYSKDYVQDAQEAFRAAGYSEAEATAAANISLALPHLPELKELGASLASTAALYRDAGDQASAQAAIQTGLDLGQRLNSGQSTLMQDIVGLSIQRQILSTLDPATPYGTAGQTVGDQIALLTQQRTAYQNLGQQGFGAVMTLPEQDVANYFERQKISGEQVALRWAVGKSGPQ